MRKFMDMSAIDEMRVSELRALVEKLAEENKELHEKIKAVSHVDDILVNAKAADLFALLHPKLGGLIAAKAVTVAYDGLFPHL
jgi:hypothetical protein